MHTHHQKRLAQRLSAVVFAGVVLLMTVQSFAAPPSETLEDWCDGAWYVVDGADGVKNSWQTFQESFTIPAGTPDVYVQAYLFTREFPTYTFRAFDFTRDIGDQFNPFNDIVEMEVSSSLGQHFFASTSITGWHYSYASAFAGLPGGAFRYWNGHLNFSSTTNDSTLTLWCRTMNIKDSIRGSGAAFHVQQGLDNGFVGSVNVVENGMPPANFLNDTNP